MEYIFTDGRNAHFAGLCLLLDEYLNIAAGGEENRSQYIPHNRLENIHDAVLAYDGEVPAGCASFKRYDADTAEVKRVFVKQEYRRNGVALKLMALLEEKAGEKGYRRLVLETGERLAESMALYRKAGYRVIDNYGCYEGLPEAVCMEKWICKQGV